jgi:hypothetical protein
MRTTVLALILAGLLPAQDKPQPKQEVTARIIEVKRGDPRRIATALRTIGAAVDVNPDLRMLVVRADKELMPAIEEAAKRLDVPAPTPRNVELTVYILQASQQPAAKPGGIPNELEGTIKQLKSIFNYQHFDVLDVAFLRGREHEHTEASGNLFIAGQTTQYQIFFERSGVTVDGQARLIRLDNLRFSGRVRVSAPGQGMSFHEVSLRTNVDVREGQKVVVGKTGMPGGDKALVLVVSGKIVE